MLMDKECNRICNFYFLSTTKVNLHSLLCGFHFFYLYSITGGVDIFPRDRSLNEQIFICWNISHSRQKEQVEFCFSSWSSYYSYCFITKNSFCFIGSLPRFDLSGLIQGMDQVLRFLLGWFCWLPGVLSSVLHHPWTSPSSERSRHLLGRGGGQFLFD